VEPIQKEKTMKKITPFLWFDTQAEDAMKLYTSIFKNSKVLGVSRGPDGRAQSVNFELEGQELIGFNAGPEFKFNESISFFVDCKDQAEVDAYWNALTADGGEESQCGWLRDKFGLSWQIVPAALGRYLSDPDPVKAQRVLQAMLKMKKIVIADLDRAYAG
jgi:predicted 3-demethylubiquinone-9 3-methyltransferase (glyoxalase superfamily)